jgi:LuxR family maltose regulon positive regulatory protein
VLEALAYEMSARHDLVRAALRRALAQARSQGYQRIFLDEGPLMEGLLKNLVPSIREEALATYVQTLLCSFASTTAHPPHSPSESAHLHLSPLTPQERRVLQLLAEGATNQNIADQLVISLATAKKHVANILSKLGAENRTQAIARARESSLLSSSSVRRERLSS